MGIIDRVILSIYTVILIVLSAGIVLLSLNLLSLDYIWTSIVRIPGRFDATLIGLVFLAVSVRLLLTGVRSRGNKDTIVHHNELGDVHISLAAVENLVEKTTRQVRGVRGVKVRVSTLAGQGMKVFIKVGIAPESGIPAVCTEIQSKVKSYTTNTIGVEASEIEIMVNNISNDFKSKQRVE